MKLDPRTGATVARRELPEDPGLSGAAYNGFDRCCPTAASSRSGSSAAPARAHQCRWASPPRREPSPGWSAPPPTHCRRRSWSSTRAVCGSSQRITPPEPVTGRVSFYRGHLYAAGKNSLLRFALPPRAAEARPRLGPCHVPDRAPAAGNRPRAARALPRRADELPALAGAAHRDRRRHARQPAGLPADTVRRLLVELDRLAAGSRRRHRHDRHPRHQPPAGWRRCASTRAAACACAGGASSARWTSRRWWGRLAAPDRHPRPHLAGRHGRGAGRAHRAPARAQPAARRRERARQHRHPRVRRPLLLPVRQRARSGSSRPSGEKRPPNLRQLAKDRRQDRSYRGSGLSEKEAQLP